MKSLSSLLFGKHCQITCSFANMQFHFSFACLIHFSVSLVLVLFLCSGTVQPSLCSPNFPVQGVFSHSVFCFSFPPTCLHLLLPISAKACCTGVQLIFSIYLSYKHLGIEAFDALLFFRRLPQPAQHHGLRRRKNQDRLPSRKKPADHGRVLRT